MLPTIIAGALVLVAVYCFAMWGWTFIYARGPRFQAELSTAGMEHRRWLLSAVASDTFHLGLCGILSLGFVLLYLKG